MDRTDMDRITDHIPITAVATPIRIVRPMADMVMAGIRRPTPTAGDPHPLQAGTPPRARDSCTSARRPHILLTPLGRLVDDVRAIRSRRYFFRDVKSALPSRL